MSTGIIVVIVVAVIVVAALVTGGMAIMRRRRLQQRFGPEYDRVAGERDSKLKADSELAERERRVRDLDIQPLTDAARASYAAQWADLQERFVDAPADAVTGSQLLVTAVMTDRGYPVENHDQVLADLSVEYSDTLGHYRAAEEISQSAAAGTASPRDQYRRGVAQALQVNHDQSSGRIELRERHNFSFSGLRLVALVPVFRSGGFPAGLFGLFRAKTLARHCADRNDPCEENNHR